MKIYFVNAGTIVPDKSNRRVLKACLLHGFVSAGQTPKDVTYICKLSVGDIVCLYESTVGYWAIGKVIRRAIPILQFRLQDKGTLHNREFVNMGNDIDKGLFKNAYDERICEYVVKVEWLRLGVKPLFIHQNEEGFFAPINTVFEINADATINRLSNYFEINLHDIVKD